MENTKTIRNPFPWIGKVYKYEMKHSSRILMPVYIAIVAIALITGLIVPLSSDGDLDFNFSFNMNGTENVMNGIAGFCFFIYWVIIIVAGVVTLALSVPSPLSTTFTVTVASLFVIVQPFSAVYSPTVSVIL